MPSKYSYLAQPESCLLLRRTSASPSQGPSPCFPRAGCCCSLWQWGKSWSTKSPDMVGELGNAARLCHRAHQEMQGGLSTQAHLQFLIANLFYQRHPQQLASVKLWHSIGNDKLLLPSLRARSLAYGWLVRGLTCLTCSPFRAGLDHSSWQVTLDHKGKTYYNSPFLNAWAEV